MGGKLMRCGRRINQKWRKAHIVNVQTVENSIAKPAEKRGFWLPVN